MTPRFRLLVGDCIDEMSFMPDKSVQCCVTSPPYFGLRDYGHPGQIGLESSPQEYVAKMVEVFREVRRLLRNDGTLWLNLGDTYAGARGAREGGKVSSRRRDNAEIPRSDRLIEGCKPKDLIGIPWRVAFALQADGWYLRQDIIWHKPNPMPESVRDRCTKAHEYLFLLTKSERYLFDGEAMREPAVGQNAHDVTGRTKQRTLADTFKRKGSKRAQAIPGQSVGTHREERTESTYDLYTRNRRSVWTVATRPYKGAHFATFPPALIKPCILAGSRPGDLVLDPFGGSGTTAEVSLRHGRRVVLCEVNPDYIPLQRQRIQDVLAQEDEL